jgi:hypothetical protein
MMTARTSDTVDQHDGRVSFPGATHSKEVDQEDSDDTNDQDQNDATLQRGAREVLNL